MLSMEILVRELPDEQERPVPRFFEKSCEVRS
jgi:hypothetical protein